MQRLSRKKAKYTGRPLGGAMVRSTKDSAFDFVPGKKRYKVITCIP